MIAQDVPGAAVTSRRRGILASERKLLLAAGDTLLVACSLILAFNLHSGPIQHASLTVPWKGVILVTALWLAIALVVDSYDLHAAVSVRGIFRVVATTVSLEGIALLAATLRDPGLISVEADRLERWIDSLTERPTPPPGSRLEGS